ncbi:phage tail tape measure protein [Deinococcus radiotolerans]|uniref:Phage tail tape measure protein domain-containing protein n=1 Tax=Deinococcus radiotolerans TaxID=1309407 RepID=A0ABQ2FR20_9DEIO|nr:phage tail tape measure protein [Deinococcus radiotolerans]GGL18271.1 hypothetical protein GCM10010844_41410 [Deinococcus radiotolerans]
MADLRDTMLLDVSQPLRALEEVEQRLTRLFREREAPALKFKLPSLPTQQEPAGSRPERRAQDSALDRLSNRLRTAQQELKRLGDDATPEQLKVIETRLSRLAQQAELLAPGLDKGSAAGARLSRVMTGIVTTSTDVQAALNATGRAPGFQTQEQQVKALGQGLTQLNRLWRLQILTDEEAGQSALKLRDQLLKLAVAEGASQNAVLAATRVATDAQRLLDQTRGEATKGGFAYNAGIAILDGLSRVRGPIGALAAGLGGAVNAGLLTGMLAGKPAVGRGAQDLGDDVIYGLKTRLQIRSPSRVTTAFGVNIAEGLALGMKSNQGQVAKAARDLGDAASSNLSSRIEGFFGPKLGQSLSTSGGAFGGVAREAANGAVQIGKFALGAEALALVAGTTASAILVLGTAFKSAITSGAAFEEQLVNIKALTQPTAAELTQLKDAAMNLGTDLGVGPKDAALAILELNKAGLSASEAIGGGLAGALNLAGAAGVTAGEGAALAVAGMNTFGLAAADLPRVADVFANFANRTVLGAQDLSQFFSALGPAAKDAGLNIEQVAGYAATLAQGGFKQMSDAGTSFKTFLTSLQAPSDTAKKALNELKVSFYDAAGASRPLGEVLEELRRKLAGMTDQARNGYIKQIFGDDASRAARVFFGSTNEAIDENIKAMGLQGEAARVARERMSSYAGQVKVLKAEWESFTAMIGLTFLPALTSVIKGIRNVVDGARGFLNDGERLKTLMKQLGIVVAGVGLAFIYLRQEMIKTAVIQAWTSAPMIFNAVRLGVLGAANVIKLSYIPAIIGAAKATAAFLVANPWLLVIAGATAAAVAIQNHFSEINNTYDQMDAANQSSFESTMKRVRGLTKEGGELNNTKAKYLLAVQSLADANQGTLKGTTLLGERIYETDDAQIAKAQQRVKELREELTRLQAEANRRGAAPPVKVVDPEQLKKQTEALRDLRKELAGRALELRVKGMTELGGQIEQLGNQFDELAIKLKTAFNWDMSSTDLQKGLAQIRAQQAREQTALVTSALDDQKEVRLGHEREVRAAEIALSKDAVAQRRAELDGQIQDLKTTYEPQIRDLLRNAQNKTISSTDRRKFQDEAGQLQQLQNRQIVALERQRDQDLERIAQERLDKVRAAQQETLASQARVSAATISVLEGQRDREIQLAGDVPAARLAIEQRFGPQLLRLKQQQIDLETEGQRIALRGAYLQQLRDAATAGDQRAELERNARDQYLNGLRVLELDHQQKVGDAQVQQEARVQEQRTAIYQQGLDRRLQGAKDATAAELRQLERVLTAERARAAAAGEGAKVAAIDKALTSINEIQADNVRAFREELKGAATTAADLQKRLADIDQTPLGKARSSAASPFNEIIWNAEKALADLKGKLSKTDLTPDLRAQYLRQQAELTRIVSQASRERNGAVLAAEQQFERERQDKAQANALKLAKTQYDTTLDSGPYLTRLDQDRQYWNARLALARQKGSEELRLQAEQALASNAEERKRVTGDTFTRKDTLDASVVKLRAAQDAQLAAQARTQQEVQAARERGLQTSRLELAQLDAQLATAKARGLTEAQINDLLAERVQKVTGINAQVKAIAQAPLQADAERVDLLQAQANLLLQQQGLADDALATAQQSLTAARQQLQLKQAALDDAEANGTPSEVSKARVDVTNAQLAVEQNIVRVRDEQDQQAVQALDHLEAQGRAALELQGLAEDAVATGELDLDVTRQRLTLAQARLASGTLTAKQEREAQLEVTRLTAQQETQERKLEQAQRDRRALLEGLVQAQEGLNRSLQGGTPAAVALRDASNGAADARVKLAQAERSYAQALADAARTPSQATTERLKTATEALTSAISDQRGALSKLADQYRSVLTSMDGVREASDKLKGAAYGDKGPAFNGTLEIDRFFAIQRRRDAAIDTLKRALASGDQDAIRAATEALATQEKRYKDQQALLAKNGISVGLTREKEVQTLADQVDALGIQNDREAINVQKRLDAATLDAQSSLTFLDAAKLMRDSSVDLLAGLTRGVRPAPQAAPITYTYKDKRFDSMAALDAYVAAERAGGTGNRAAAPGNAADAQMGTKNVTITNTTTFHIPVTVDGQPVPTPQEFRQIAEQVLGEALNGALRNAAWAGGPCKT